MKQKVLATLADLVALIHHIFLSLNRFSITKEELVHKIIMNNSDILERSMCEPRIILAFEDFISIINTVLDIFRLFKKKKLLI